MNLRRDKPGTELPTQTPPEPTVPEVIAGLQIELRQTETLIRMREAEIADLNVKAAELAGQIQWLFRTPQAVKLISDILRKHAQ
jgi:hypothetical protein